MSFIKGSQTKLSTIRKLQPKAKLPEADVLKAFEPEKVAILERRLAEQAECIHNDSFLLDDAETKFMGPLPSGDGTVEDSSDSGIDLLTRTSARNLTSEQEQHLFLRLNYCSYGVMRILREAGDKPLSANAANALIYWECCRTQTRDDIVRLNVALVLAMAKRTRLTGVDQADLISEGNLALMRSVVKFDCSRGFKFSTYACRAILKSFSRVATRTARYRGQFPTEFDPTLEKSDYVASKRKNVETDCLDELKSILGENLAHLSEVENRVIRARFAIDGEHDEIDVAKGKTLEQVGSMIGVTKERVRQIQNKALDKLRNVLEDGILSA